MQLFNASSLFSEDAKQNAMEFVNDPEALRQKLVEILRGKGISDERVLSAINAIPRHAFMDAAFLEHARILCAVFAERAGSFKAALTDRTAKPKKSADSPHRPCSGTHT